MSEQMRISGKSLGEVALGTFCPRCFWIKLSVSKLPFQIFPGIFSSIDSYTKKIVHGWFDKYKASPPWLNPLGKIIGFKEPPHYSKFFIIDKEFNIKLTGAPDGILVRDDKSNVIVDYKTARYTEAQDELLPLYEVQLNSYALIGESNGFSPVSGLALIYFEPATDELDACDGNNHKKDGFSMGFKAHVHPVKLDLKTIRPLLAKTREIYDMKTPPNGVLGCDNCRNLEALIKVLGV